jgi:hypothetical protein
MNAMNNFEAAVREMDLTDETERESFIKMAKFYEQGLPDTLYMDPYELHVMTNFHNGLWKRFLKLPQVIQLIESEAAMIAEVKARSALRRLGSNEAVSPSEVAAVKALLDKAQILQEKQRDQKTIIFHHIPLQED